MFFFYCNFVLFSVSCLWPLLMSSLETYFYLFPVVLHLSCFSISLTHTHCLCSVSCLLLVIPLTLWLCLGYLDLWLHPGPLYLLLLLVSAMNHRPSGSTRFFHLAGSSSSVDSTSVVSSTRFFSSAMVPFYTSSTMAISSVSSCLEVSIFAGPS